MKLLYCILFFIGFHQLHAQDTLPAKPVTRADSVGAKFPGGDAAFREFLAKHLRKEVAAKNGAPVGLHKVVVAFLIEKDGSVSEVKILEDPGYGTGEEVMRVIKKSPRWFPATIQGKPVRYRQRQSISFAVSEDGRGKRNR
ncbi:energy transducer TonB [Filimonas effusa]|nr:energy transducer TonB [Filimonas effusa]